LLVVLFHASGLMNAPKYWGEKPYGSLFDTSYAGVEFFFVLSGFIIAYAHHQDIGNPAAAGRYALRRVTRIYPIYWLVTLAVLPFSPNEWADVAGSLTLLPFNGPVAALAVGWTLFHEVLFYVFFAILILNLRAGLLVGSIWFASIALWPSAVYVTQPINLLFFVGMAAFLAFRSLSVPAPRTIAVLGCAIFAVTCAMVGDSPTPLALLGFGVGSGLAILGAAAAEKAGLSASAPLVLLGAASYSIYLIHYPALSLLAKILIRLPSNAVVPTQVTFLLLVVGAVAAGILFYLLIEKPLLALFRAPARRLSSTHSGRPRPAKGSPASERPAA
jgi:exopolysaccharide production protein ExoZ